ncbi:MAG: TonB family protein [Terracidiphilus sp.]
MSTLIEHEEQLDRELSGERVAAPATSSVLLHLALAGAIVTYYVAGGFFHSDTWGGANSGGAIRVNLVSSAIPLPADQPPNQNVLATQTPSQAPAPPTPKATQKIDEDAIAIQGKKVQPKPETAPRTPPRVVQQQPDNRAEYGEEQANNLSRGVQAQSNPGPTSITQGDFGSRFPWYVQQINSKMAQTWNKFEVDPRTPRGARVYLDFTIHRDGSPSNIQLQQSSGSPTLDRSCMRGVERVDTFGALPPGYSGSTLNVSYYCEY